ncbi:MULTISPECIES: hypothetical protein [unclassified Archaeoglobus]|jgi:predicted nucleic acid-binding Zn ribbon protein|nr:MULTISPECIES: hypothetical protein [unclassified Archaeoglobus]
MIAVKVGLMEETEGEVKTVTEETCPELLRKAQEELEKQRLLNLLLILLIIGYMLYKLLKKKNKK